MIPTPDAGKRLLDPDEKIEPRGANWPALVEIEIWSVNTGSWQRKSYGFFGINYYLHCQTSLSREELAARRAGVEVAPKAVESESVKHLPVLRELLEDALEWMKLPIHPGMVSTYSMKVDALRYAISRLEKEAL
jgi:hypothetical protein